uniref:Transmembrane receptor, eukaryota n=1 Tax=Panagrellus redivivus TaxID=6233 RepID=A0A7E4ULE5_PANRE
MHLLSLIATLSLAGFAAANLLIPGIIRKDVNLTQQKIEYYGIFQSALNNSEVEIRLTCEDDIDATFSVQYVVRTSPCAKEFFTDRNRRAYIDDMLEFYFDQDKLIPNGFHYENMYFYRSVLKNISCQHSNGVTVFLDENLHQPMHLVNVTEYKPPLNGTTRAKREALLNGNTIDGGAKQSLTSWHPALVLPADSLYVLIVKFAYVGSDKPNVVKSFNVQLETQWRGPNGYLSAIDYPLLHFYGFMCAVYIVLSLVWLFICMKHWRDLLRIQFWIGAVIVVGMVEKAVFYAEYSNMNDKGESVEGLIEFAELTSCFKRTVAHVLVIIVSVGYGVVKPRLGTTLNQVIAAGFFYFVFCSIEGLTRVSRTSVQAIHEKQVAKLPLVVLEVGIAYWIFSSLIATMRSLRMRRNDVKLALYRHFTNVLCLSVVVAVVYMIWSIYIHSIRRCVSEWKQLWIDTAFWHIYFVSILIVIMYLWRPAANNQRYAFTPLLDDSEDENDEDELFNGKIAAYDDIKHRQTERIEMRPQKSNDEKLEDDLRWIETNIPSSLAEALLDDEDEAEARELEMSKML